MTVIATSYGELDAPSGERAADEILATHPEIDGFFASNDQIAIGISRVLRSRGLWCRSSVSMGPKDAVEEIRAGGPIIATATQDPAALVRAAMEIGSALHGGARVARPSHYLVPRLINARNAMEYQPWGRRATSPAVHRGARVLDAISSGAASTPAALGVVLGLPKSSIADLLGTLETAGLVARGATAVCMREPVGLTCPTPTQWRTAFSEPVRRQRISMGTPSRWSSSSATRSSSSTSASADIRCH